MTEISEIFICQQCGYCCQGETTVSLDENDQKRMTDHLGMKREEVCRKFWRLNGNTIQMKTVDGHCIFFDSGCTIHSGKPWRCTQWPLHPSILAARENYEIIKQSCPGINAELSYEEFCAKFSALRKTKKIQD
ncbi:MAG: YkgJ family cysteine cluster protein [Desulfobulbales bacterium]|nr:YkgJ family cysteine cluster protein [Desulfobulbales bacterium]